MTILNQISPGKRRKKLKELLEIKRPLRFLEAHDGLSSIIVEETKITVNNGDLIEFDGIWESSFTDSASKGYPDADIISIDSRFESLRFILDSTSKPVIFDGDTGGDLANFEYLVKRLEYLGVSMVIIEDKVFPKRNSLDPECSQTQEDPNKFALKIKRGKQIQFSDEFFIAARIESLISGAGLKDAIFRAKKYVEAGADAIMIHSKNDDPNEIIEFAKAYNELCSELGFRKPLICVPTTYNMITEEELSKYDFDIVIYANHLLRAAHKAMQEAAKKILKYGRGFEVESICTPVKEIFDKVGLSVIKDLDKFYQTEGLQVIIPAAGEAENFNMPKAMVKIKNKPILQRQIDVLNKFNINKITLIRGYKKEDINLKGIKYIDNDNYKDYYLLHSLFCAEDDFDEGFLYINSDILFTEVVISNVLNTHHDIVLVVDRSYKYHKHGIDKNLDLVLTKNKPTEMIYSLYGEENEVIRIGKNINIEMADYEYIGIAYFSKFGAEVLKKVYHNCSKNWNGPFHEAIEFKQADFMDLIQEIINRGFRVYTAEVHKGWIEINDQNDVKLAELMI
ncbi:MAG: phosphoenolpyruvate mutase [Promethearchaeota archaeon]